MAKEASSESGKVISLPTGAVCFGPFRFDPTNVTLSRGDAHVHLPPRALGVLEYLVRRHGLLVSKEELLDAVWADIHVTEDALTQAISLIRQALGDDSRDPSFVETVPRLGYRFVAKVSAVPSGKTASTAGELVAGGDLRLTLSTQLPLWRRSLPWALAAVSLAIAAGAVLWAVRWSTIPPASPPSPSPLSSKITIRPPGEMHLEPGGRDRVMVSPDGSTIAYLAQPGPAAGLYLHSLDTWDPDGPIAGLGVSSGRVFSPDGNWIAFFQNGKLKKVSVHGGPPEDICDLPAEPGHLSATWMPDGTIIFMAQRRLWRVSDQVGEPEPVAVPNAAAGEVAYFWPQVIPENDAVTYAILTPNIQHMDDARIAVLDLDTLKSHIVGTGSAPVVSPTGHLLFVQGGVLFAVAFDLETHMPYGPSVLVQQGLGVDKWGFPSYAVAENGSLVYVPGGHVTGDQLVWVDQSNSITKAIDELLMLNGIHLSPSGQLVALDVGVFNPDILIYDLSGGPVVRVAGDGGQRFSTWTRDGGRFFFRETIAGVSSLHSFDLDTRERAPFNPELGEYTDPVPYSVSPDGKWMTLEARHPSTGRDILRVPLEGDLVARPWLATSARETYPLISPDGRLIAYRSDESGRNYVQVRAVSATTPLGTRAMSKGTGALKWGADSRSLYYIQPSSGPFSPTRVWTVSIGPEAEPTIGTPELAFDPDESVYWAQRLWDVSVDGRLLAAKNAQTGDREIRVILNWFEELMEQVPTRQ